MGWDVELYGTGWVCLCARECMCMYACRSAHVYVYIYACVCVCVCVYIPCCFRRGRVTGSGVDRA